MTARRRPAIIAAVVAGIVLAGVLVVNLLKEPEEFAFHETDIYFTFDFEPSYRRADCIVRIDIEVQSEVDDHPALILFRSFAGYLRANAPRAAYFQYRYQPDTGSMYLLFANACERRFDISRAMAAAAMGYHPALQLKVIPGHYEPGPQTVDWGEALWIDSPGYDPEDWVFRKAAFRGDGERLLIIAKQEDPAPDENYGAEGAYMFYSLAAKRLPPGPDRDFAERRMPELMAMVAEDRRDWVLYHARRWDAAIRIYGEGDGRE